MMKIYDKMTAIEKAQSDEKVALELSHLVEAQMRSAIIFAEKMKAHINQLRESAEQQRLIASADLPAHDTTREPRK